MNHSAPLFAIWIAASLFAAACSASTPEAMPPSVPPLVVLPHAAVAPVAPHCSASCTGTVTPALVAQLRARAKEGQQCYQRLLRTREAKGSIVVTVQMEPEGLCQLSMKRVDPGLEPLEPCIRQLFEGQPYAAPEGGCVTINIPLVFSIRDRTDRTDAPDAGP